MIFRFIKLIPAFYRLFCDYEMTPEDIRFSLEQYTRVIDRLTGGRMSKVNYYADDIVSQELKKHDWIPVKEQLPEEKENPVTHDFCEVICYCQFGGVPKADDVRVFKFGNGHFYHGSQIMDGIVTHWQYLPEPPEEGEQE